MLCFFFLMIRRPPRSTPFPTRRSSDLRALLYDATQWTAEAVLLSMCHPRTSRPKRLGPDDHRGSGPCRQRCDSERCRSEEHTSELQSRQYLVCRLLLEKKNKQQSNHS